MPVVDDGATPVRVRVATGADAALLAELGARTFRDAFGAQNTAADMAAYLAGAFGADIQARELEDPASTFLVAEVAHAPAGYARVRTGPAPMCVPDGEAAELVRFYCEAEWIGRGVGGPLMVACLRQAERAGATVAWLDVWERNPRAIAFYRKWGFEVCGAQSFVLGDDVQHDLVMTRRLRSPRRGRVGYGQAEAAAATMRDEGAGPGWR